MNAIVNRQIGPAAGFPGTSAYHADRTAAYRQAGDTVEVLEARSSLVDGRPMIHVRWTAASCRWDAYTDPTAITITEVKQ